MYNSANGLLKVSGRYLVDNNGAGNRFKLAGVNWAGFHEDNMVLGGLDIVNSGTPLPITSIISQVFTGWGFNSVRLPFATNTILSTVPVNAAFVNSANTTLFNNWLATNPAGVNTSLGMTPWNLYQWVVYELTQAQVCVIPNFHLLYQGWCCSPDDTNGLWWNDNWSYATFLSTWQTVATAFASNPYVIGYDIKNEPRQALIGGKWYYPTWGNGVTTTDFLWMYNQVGPAIQTIDANALLFIEPCVTNLDSLQQHQVTPKTANTVVYSSHNYPFNASKNMTLASFNNYQNNTIIGGTINPGRAWQAPYWMGEFGMLNTSTALLGVGTPGNESAAAEAPGSGGGNIYYRNWWGWMQTWHQENDPDWCWWHIAGYHVKGTRPSLNQLAYNYGDHCWDGLLSSSWNGASNYTLLTQLQALMAPRGGPGTPYY
jgi:hypothetical protein